MELVRGRTVGQELRRLGPLQPDRAEHMIRQAAAGLAAAHAEGMVHRDIKPDNLLLTSDGCVKVADFGIVRFLDDATTTLTSAGHIVGTSHFLSPERVLGKPAEPASDVYALGCVLYQLLTGRPPFISGSPASVMFQHVQREPTPPTELRAELPSELEALTLWMLTKDPGQRPTAGEIAIGVRRPTVMVPESDMATTVILPVRRKSTRTVFIGAVAVAALAVSATVGVLSGATDAQLPTTSDLNPSDTKRTPPPAPRTAKSPAPSVVRTVTHTTTAKPEVAPQPSPAKPKTSSSPSQKTSSPQQQKQVGPHGPAKHETRGPLKPKKPKP